MQSIPPFEQLFEIAGGEPFPAPAFDMGMEHICPAATRFFTQK
jgi:hypothetical protein